MLNKSAATDARHSRSGKDAMLYNSSGKPFAQVESFTTKGSFNNYKYAPLGQNRELEVNGTVGVTVNIYLSHADVWEKVKDGTYSMFSIEGKAERV